jgi:hypothetical protein
MAIILVVGEFDTLLESRITKKAPHRETQGGNENEAAIVIDKEKITTRLRNAHTHNTLSESSRRGILKSVTDISVLSLLICTIAVSPQLSQQVCLKVQYIVETPLDPCKSLRNSSSDIIMVAQ